MKINVFPPQIITSITFCLTLLSSSVSGQTQSLTYNYDVMNRLTKVIYPDGSSITYTYDYAGNRTSIKVTGVEFKADVTPRPSGKKDGTVSLLDWVQVGRLAFGLDTASNGSEFQRADCHPRESYGNGKLDLFDWVQAGRFFAGLDDLVPAAGGLIQQNLIPIAGVGKGSNNSEIRTSESSSLDIHSIRALKTAFYRGEISELRITLDALGNENALAFSINFDPKLLSFVDAVPAIENAGAQLITLPNQALTGKVGIGIALAPGQVLTAGAHTVAILRFRALPGRGEAITTLKFGGLPTEQGISDANASPLRASFSDAAITITKDLNPEPIIANTFPNAVFAGSPGISLKITGENFVDGSRIFWNGDERPTRYISEGELAAEISPTDLENAGTASVKVNNPVPGGGVSNAALFSIKAPPIAKRTIRVVSASASPGESVKVPIEVTAQEGENSFSFSLSYDPNVLTAPKLTLTGDTEDATLLVNESRQASGRLGVALSMPIGQKLNSGTRQLVIVTFKVAADTQLNSATLELGDFPVPRAVTDTAANALSVEWNPAEISINRSVVSVSAASYDGSTLSSNMIVAAFGAGMASTTQAAPEGILPLKLGGATVTVKDSAGTDHEAQLFFVSPDQVNFLMPANTSVGKAELLISNGAGAIYRGTIYVEKVTPGIFSADSSGQGIASALVLRVSEDGSTRYEPVVDYDRGSGTLVPRPIDLGNSPDKVFLVFFGTGIRNRTSLSEVKARLGEEQVSVTYAGDQTGFAGLDQINVYLPPSLAGRGDVEAVFWVDGRPTNVVKVRIK